MLRLSVFVPDKFIRDINILASRAGNQLEWSTSHIVLARQKFSKAFCSTARLRMKTRHLFSEIGAVIEDGLVAGSDADEFFRESSSILVAVLMSML